MADGSLDPRRELACGSGTNEDAAGEQVFAIPTRKPAFPLAMQVQHGRTSRAVGRLLASRSPAHWNFLQFSLPWNWRINLGLALTG